MLETIYALIEHVFHSLWVRGNAFVIGIDGLDCSGKTRFSRGLANRFRQKDEREVVLIHLDDFNNAAVQRKIYEALAEGTLSDFRRNQFYEDGRDHARAVQAIEAEEQAHRDSLLIVEGALLRKTFPNGLGYNIVLNVDPAVAEGRYRLRREAEGDVRSEASFRELWLPTYTRYVEEHDPLAKSDRVIDNNDYEHPIIVSK